MAEARHQAAKAHHPACNPLGVEGDEDGECEQREYDQGGSQVLSERAQEGSE